MSDAYFHPKGRSCERTDEVLENYKKRAERAEMAVARVRRATKAAIADRESAKAIWCSSLLEMTDGVIDA